MVIKQSVVISADLNVDMNMVYTIAAYHDTGLTVDRKTHHIVSGKIVREDMWLRDWFNEEQIEAIAQACEDHRASSDHEPRSIYGKSLPKPTASSTPTQSYCAQCNMDSPTILNLTRKDTGSAPLTTFTKNMPKAAISTYGLRTVPT